MHTKKTALQYLKNILIFITTVFVSITANAASTIKSVQYDTSANVVILQYDQIPDMLKHPDITPILTIYGDGRVVTHIALYKKNSGDYAFALSPTELDSLIKFILEKNLHKFNIHSVRNQMKTIQHARQSFYSESDLTQSVFTLNVISFTDQSNKKITLQKAIKIKAENIQSFARKYPSISALQNLTAVEQRLQQLMNDPRRVKQ